MDNVKSNVVYGMNKIMEDHKMKGGWWHIPSAYTNH